MINENTNYVMYDATAIFLPDGEDIHICGDPDWSTDDVHISMKDGTTLHFTNCDYALSCDYATVIWRAYGGLLFRLPVPQSAIVQFKMHHSAHGHVE